MSWQAIAKPVETDVFSEAIDENLTLYSLSNVVLGGNWRLVKCNLAVSPPTCQALNTGIPVPSTDGHFNLRELLLEGEYLYGCYARWSELNCYRFNKNTGAGMSIGSVAPGGDRSLNYHKGVKIKEDTYYYKARVGTGTEWKLWRFKGSPSQITDSALWEEIGYIIRDPTSPSTCPEGSINYSYCWSSWVYERYWTIRCYQRCPSGNVGNFALFFFDTVKERLYNSNFEEVPLQLTTTDPRVKITVTNPPITSPAKSEFGGHVIDILNRRAYVVQRWYSSAGFEEEGITKVDLTTRQAEYVRIPGSWLQILGLTVDGKVVFVHIDTDNVTRVKVLDPATNGISNILEIGGKTYAVPLPCLNTEDIQIPVTTIFSIATHIILPPNWQDGLKIPKRIEVSSPRAEQLRVRAEFQLAPSNIRIRIWEVPSYVIEKEETLPGSTSIDRTYNVIPGTYRVEVTAL